MEYHKITDTKELYDILNLNRRQTVLNSDTLGRNVRSTLCQHNGTYKVWLTILPEEFPWPYIEVYVFADRGEFRQWQQTLDGEMRQLVPWEV